MRRISLVFTFLIALLTISCSSTSSTLSVSDFYDWYTPWIDDETIDELYKDCMLQEGEEPEVYYSDDLGTDIDSMLSKYYTVLGVSSFNGISYEGAYNAVYEFCKDVGAKVAIYSIIYTDTRNGIYGYNDYVNSYSIDRYDYIVYLFIPRPSWSIITEAKIGLYYDNLENVDRISSGYNTGAIIKLVYEGSSAFYANLIPGDIIIEVNDVPILDSTSLDEVFDSLTYGDSANITFVRNGIERNVEMPIVWQSWLWSI